MTTLAQWQDMSDDERIALVERHANPTDILDLISLLASAYPDAGSQVRAAQLLARCPSFAPRPCVQPARRVASYYYQLSGGGIESSLITLTTELGKSRAAFILADRIVGSFATETEETTQADRIAQDQLVLLETCGDTHAAALKEALITREIDTLIHHAWCDRQLLWDIVLCRVLGVRIVVFVHGAFSHFVDVSDASFEEWNDGRFFSSITQALSLADAVITLSELNRRFFSVFNPQTYTVVHRLSAPYRDALTLPRTAPDVPTILWVGRFDPYKHPEDALEVLAQTRLSIPDAQLLYVGSGNNDQYQRMLEERARELGISEAVSFAGFHEDVRPYYLSSSVLLETTEVEGFCLVLAEACACGLPIVAYELPNVPFSSCDGISWVAQNDVAAAARASVKLLQDATLRDACGRAERSFVGHELEQAYPTRLTDVLDALESDRAPQPATEQDRALWTMLLEHYVRGQERAHAALVAERERARRADEELARYRDDVQHSPSFRIGRAVTALPRKILGRG